MRCYLDNDMRNNERNLPAIAILLVSHTIMCYMWCCWLLETKFWISHIRTAAQMLIIHSIRLISAKIEGDRGTMKEP